MMMIVVVREQDVHLALRKNMATWEKLKGCLTQNL